MLDELQNRSIFYKIVYFSWMFLCMRESYQNFQRKHKKYICLVVIVINLNFLNKKKVINKRVPVQMHFI